MKTNLTPGTLAPQLRKYLFFLLIAMLLFSLNQCLEVLAIKCFNPSAGYSNLCRFDCRAYSDIARNGYQTGAGSAEYGKGIGFKTCAFFPVLPIIAKMLTSVTGIFIEKSVVLVSKAFFLFSIFAFIVLGKLYRPSLNPILLGSVVALNPYSIYGNTGYTDPLFLFFTCIFFISLRKGMFIQAGLIGSILGGVRSVGMAALLPYLSEAFRSGFIRKNTRKAHLVLGLLIIPFGLVLFMAYLYFRTGDAQAWFHAQKLWRTAGLQNPVNVIISGINGDALYKYFLMTFIGAIGSVTYLFFRKDFDLGLFSLGCTLIPFASDLWGMSRYVWWQAPILLVIAIIISKKRIWALTLPVFIAGLMYMYYNWFLQVYWIT